MSKETYYYDDSTASESGEEEEEEEEEIIGELRCRNMDPALAKLMGIIIEEQQISDWVPPSKSGLDNSKEIVSSSYFNNKGVSLNDVDFFKVIKDDIINYKTLSDRQLNYIKNLNNEEKFELIKIYNRILDSRSKK